jgi:hypothetical protein
MKHSWIEVCISTRLGYLFSRCLEPHSSPSPDPWIIGVSAKFLVLRFTKLMHVSSSTDHWQDIVAGSLLGFIIANFSYRQYFPSLGSKRSHLPYAPRTLHPEDSRRSASVLPYYHRRSMDSQGEAEVELLSGAVSRDNVRRNEHEQPEQPWERGPSVEDGNFRS